MLKKKLNNNGDVIVPKNKRELNKYYAVKFNGKIKHYLSTKLAIKQNINLDQLDVIKSLHVDMLKLFEEIEKETNKSTLKKMASSIQELEFKMQEAWGFNKDAKYHSWWYKAPRCECPVMDNEDRVGTSYSIVNPSCPLHGHIVTKNIN